MTRISLSRSSPKRGRAARTDSSAIARIPDHPSGGLRHEHPGRAPVL
jgi:hypothetical protein